ncbi:MAG: exodeoxyribonuclease V subunit beta [Deltaproteobacteria bacterium]|nr:exodeoxyribonuclease V subunit beta [Deltaproteobacteria bacterium]
MRVPVQTAEFNALAPLPKDGRLLIEASAGTGKTYALTSLICRLIVLDDRRLEEILAITFTRAATAELKERIRLRLTHLRQALSGGEAADEFESELLKEIDRRYGGTGRELTLRRVALALATFDQASVFTIHSFCERMLREFAFESCVIFESELIEDDSRYFEEAKADYWRKNFGSTFSSDEASWLYHNDWTFSKILQVSPLQLGMRDVRFNNQGEIPCGPTPQRFNASGVIKEYRDLYNAVKKTYQEEELISFIEKNGLGRSRAKLLREVGRIVADREGMIFLKGDEFSQSFLEKGAQAVDNQTVSSICALAAWQRERMARGLMDLISWHRKAALEQIAVAMRRRKNELGQISFDDLISLMRASLSEGPQCNLACLVRKRFPVALVDEYQDTDPDQFEILSAIYPAEEEGAALIVVGDPKQSIYAFRGADIYAYLTTKSRVQTHATLATNRRSIKPLVDAVNHLFGSESARGTAGGNGAPPFYNELITYESNHAYNQSRVELGGRALTHALTLCNYNRDAGNSDSVNEEIVAHYEALEIARMLAEDTLTLFGPQDGVDAKAGEQRKIRASDIAVLVGTHQQGRRMIRELIQAGVNAVSAKSGSVFDTREAHDLAAVLQALLSPSDHLAFMSAAITPLLGLDPVDIEGFGRDGREFTVFFEEMLALGELWHREGVHALGAELLRRAGTTPRLASWRGGERVITNYRHLTELLAAQAHATQCGPAALLAWLKAGIAREQPRPADHEQLRLESDEDAVRVMTIHAAKGLEFPVVFVPFMWRGPVNPKPPLTYHLKNSNGDYARVLDVSVEFGGSDERSALVLNEIKAEDARLLYVAITRAKYICRLAWAPAGNRSRRIRPWVMDDLFKEALGPKPGELSWLKVLEHDGGMDSEGGGSSVSVAEQAANEDLRPPLKFTAERQLKDPYGRTSFSGLKRKADLRDLRGGEDEAEVYMVNLGDGSGREESAPDIAPPVAGLPAGTEAGSCLHHILEKIDFCDVQSAKSTAMIERALTLWGVQPDDQTAAVAAYREAVLRTMSTPLDVGSGVFRLSEIAPEDRLAEVAFCFSIGNLNPARLANILRECGSARAAAISARVSRLKFSEVYGFLDGFIDLVFRKDRKYHIVDWKSNYLGEHALDYAPERLAWAMDDSLYTLQYLLYAVSLHRYLRLRLKEYEPSLHLGTVIYPFVRGMPGKKGPCNHSVYIDVIIPEQIARLSSLMGGES